MNRFGESATSTWLTRTGCAAAAVVAALGIAPSAAAAPPANCGGPWGARLEGGPPGFGAGDAGGTYLWHDTSGFHLRVTHRGDGRDVYTGTIVSPTPLRVTPVALDPSDHLAVGPDGRSVSFLFNDYGRVDGFDFVTDCAENLSVGPLTGRDGPMPPQRVYLGAYQTHPAAVPFTVARWDG